MKVILVRHGAYTPKHLDPEEGLSSEGKLEVEDLLKRLKSKNISFDKIYSSPKTRAFQTATILSEGMDVEITDLLKGDEQPEDIKALAMQEEGTTLLVGHNPFMGVLASLYGANVHFNTAGCLIIADSKTAMI